MASLTGLAPALPSGGSLSPWRTTTASMPMAAAPSRSDLSAKWLRSRQEKLTTTGTAARALISEAKMSGDIFTRPSELSTRLTPPICSLRRHDLVEQRSRGDSARRRNLEPNRGLAAAQGQRSGQRPNAAPRN